MCVILQLLSTLVSSISWTSAYLIDDSNQTIVYTPAGRWEGFSCSSCQDGTATYNPFGCNTTDDCHMLLPFTGSGITLFMTLVYPTNFTVSIDGSTPAQFQFSGVPSALFKFSAYDKQSLQFGSHTLDLRLLDDAEETSDSAHNSNFLFDYAVINDTQTSVGPSTTVPTTVTEFGTSSLPSGSSSHSGSPPPSSLSSSSSDSTITGSVVPPTSSTPATSPLPSSSPPSNSTITGKNTSVDTTIAIAVPIAGVVVAALIAFVISWKNRWFGLNGGRDDSAARRLKSPRSYNMQQVPDAPKSLMECESDPVTPPLPSLPPQAPMVIPSQSARPPMLPAGAAPPSVPSPGTAQPSPSMAQPPPGTAQPIPNIRIAEGPSGLSQQDVNRIADSLAQRLTIQGPSNAPPPYQQ